MTKEESKDTQALGVAKEELIKKDTKIICDYLGIDIPEIEISQKSSEGLTLTNKIIIGVKKGYKRKMLIHELIHQKAKRWNHTYPSDFFAATFPIDELSGFIEERLFGVNAESIELKCPLCDGELTVINSDHCIICNGVNKHEFLCINNELQSRKAIEIPIHRCSGYCSKDLTNDIECLTCKEIKESPKKLKSLLDALDKEIENNKHTSGTPCPKEYHDLCLTCTKREILQKIRSVIE